MVKQFSLIVFMSIFFCCKSTKSDFSIEKKPTPVLTNSYFTNWVSGVKGGGAGYSIFLFFEENDSLDFKGVYFKNRYAKIKFQGKNKYQAFIKSNQNREEIPLDGEEEIEIKQKPTVEKIPFELSKNEAVISYLEKGKLKFMKIVLTEKENEHIPM